MTDNINTLPTLLQMPREKTATSVLLFPEWHSSTQSKVYLVVDLALCPVWSVSQGYIKSLKLDPDRKDNQFASPLAVL